MSRRVQASVVGDSWLISLWPGSLLCVQAVSSLRLAGLVFSRERASMIAAVCAMTGGTGCTHVHTSRSVLPGMQQIGSSCSTCCCKRIFTGTVHVLCCSRFYTHCCLVFVVSGMSQACQTGSCCALIGPMQLSLGVYISIMTSSKSAY